MEVGKYVARLNAAATTTLVSQWAITSIDEKKCRDIGLTVSVSRDALYT